jgi:hypothetical protein
MTSRSSGAIFQEDLKTAWWPGRAGNWYWGVVFRGRSQPASQRGIAPTLKDASDASKLSGPGFRQAYLTQTLKLLARLRLTRISGSRNGRPDRWPPRPSLNLQIYFRTFQIRRVFRECQYRVYTVGADGHFKGFEELICCDDGEAVADSKRLVVS